VTPPPTPGKPKEFTWDAWVKTLDVPLYRGYYVPDLRTVELGWWERRGCHAAFVQLAGQEGICESRLSEIPPGGSLPPFQLGVDELVYVLSGRGLTTVWDRRRQAHFEWQPHSLFMLPRRCRHQLHNMQGDQPARLLHYNYLPLAMSVISDPDFFFHELDYPSELGDDLYSEAKLVETPNDSSKFSARMRTYWYGNFMPDMLAWDKLIGNERRGAGGRVVFIQFPDSEMFCHMSVFDARTYKKAHRHGPGRCIVIPGGEGYSVMWEEGKERVVCPWREGSMLVPPNRWFHQHFNVGSTPARYLALHPPNQFSGHSEKVQDRARDQIEYPDEDPWIRRTFEERLAEKGLSSLMPDEAYRDRDYTWPS